MDVEMRQIDASNSKTSHHSVMEVQPSHDRDATILARMGKKQVLKVYASGLEAWHKILIALQRNLGFMSMLSFSCTILATWEGVLM